MASLGTSLGLVLAEKRSKGFSSQDADPRLVSSTVQSPAVFISPTRALAVHTSRTRLSLGLLSCMDRRIPVKESFLDRGTGVLGFVRKWN